ncbi:hypothetical protein D3C76_1113490 [compost metagenome]
MLRQVTGLHTLGAKLRLCFRRAFTVCLCIVRRELILAFLPLLLLLLDSLTDFRLRLLSGGSSDFLASSFHFGLGGFLVLVFLLVLCHE